ncbi:MAG: hypothetical protein COB04_15325 [Gammaproteobacteria bacterium]|nr:MAG: hypothetical protein COB04_15325 [Gammaproteobacteria bacterium]
MAKLEFTKQEMQSMVDKLQAYFEKELHQEIGGFDTEFLLEFFSENIGAHFYNRGLQDAKAIFEAKIESIDEEIYSIEKVIES